VLDKINERRESALRDKMKYEADYGRCLKKSQSKEEALTCLARWEAAASEYHKAEIEFTSEIERRDFDAIDVINQQLSSLSGRLARMRQSANVVSAKEQAAVYQGSLDRLNAEIAQAKKNGMDPARLENLETQARYLSQAVENVQYADMGLQGSEVRIRDAIETYRKLAAEREAILSESKSATLLARVQFQSAESLRLARRAEIDLTWPTPPPPCGRKEVCGLCGPFETLEACLASSPSATVEVAKGSTGYRPPAIRTPTSARRRTRRWPTPSARRSSRSERGLTMTALMLSASLFFVSADAQTTAQPPAQTKTTPQAVSLVDLLVEGQTLYTLAVDKQPESLTAALELARQAQQAVADETVKKRLGAGARPDDRDLTVLGALRARISILVSGIEKRREYFAQQYTDIEKMIQRNRLADAHLALDSVPADAPTADPVCPFADLRAELQRLESQAHAKELKSSGSIGNRKWLTQGWSSRLYSPAPAPPRIF
jgi:hypothetical protein